MAPRTLSVTNFTSTSSSTSSTIVSPVYHHTATYTWDPFCSTGHYAGPHRPEPPAPERHVLTIINFQSFADLSSRREFTPDNVDFLDAECRLHLDAIEEISLFTWCRHFDHTEISSVTVRNLCHLVSTRIRETWDIRIPGHTLELRGNDSFGETVQIDEELSIGEALEAWFPRWRTWQQSSFHPELLPI